MNVIDKIEKDQMDKISAERSLPEFGAGDTLKVDVKIVEGDKERVQAFEGLCIARSGGGLNESFTVRKISYGEGVERIFPIFSPSVDSVVLVRSGSVRRAKLYYLRNLTGKKARIVERIRAKQPDLASQFTYEEEIEYLEEELAEETTSEETVAVEAKAPTEAPAPEAPAPEAPAEPSAKEEPKDQ